METGTADLTLPMPNDRLGELTVVASVYYTDAIATVLLLGKESPFFHVGQVELDTGKLRIETTHENIVPAVVSYEQWGGDY